MALTLLHTPAQLVFSKNPVVFTFGTDNRYTSLGLPAIMRLDFPIGQVDPVSFKLSWAGSTYTFKFVNTPDNSGLQLPAYTSGSVSDWLNVIQSALQQHYYLGNDFIITHDTANTLTFTAREPGTKYTLTYTNINLMSVTVSYIQSAQERVMRPNFAIYLELWVENEDRTSFIKHSQTVAEVDGSGQAQWDVQDYLTSILLADGPLLPDMSNDVVYVDRRSIRHFFLRYAEMYGEPQIITKFFSTPFFVVFLGGTQYEVDILERFVNNGANAFMSTSLKAHAEQQAYVSIANLIEDIDTEIAIKIHLFYSDRQQEVIEIASLPNWKLYDKIVVPIGVTQFANLARDDVEIMDVKLWFENHGAPISITYDITIDNRYLPYGLTLCYVNSLGCISTLFTYGRKQRSYEVEKSQEVFAYIDNSTQHKTREMDIDIRDVLKINSGFLSAVEIGLFRDFMLSTFKYIIQDGRLIPVILDSSTIEEQDDASNLRSLSFGLKYANEQLNYG